MKTILNHLWLLSIIFITPITTLTAQKQFRLKSPNTKIEVNYTQGAMRNATKGNYRPIYSEAMSQDTRCRQLAQYVTVEHPLNMLCDSPINYMEEKECTRFISSIPTTWDNTISLDGEIGKFIVIARQKGNEWFLGSLTNWDKRKLVIDLSFLGTSLLNVKYSETE